MIVGGGRRAFGVVFRAAGVIAALIPVGGPLPGVAGHVVEAITIRREGFDRGEGWEAILGGVLRGKFPLPDIHHPLSAGFHFITPDILFPGQATAGGKFPLRFRGKTFPGPLGVSRGILPVHADHGISLPRGRTGRAHGLTPRGAFHVFPPGQFVVERHRFRSGAEIVGPRLEHRFINLRPDLFRKVFLLRRFFRGGHIAGGFHKSAELPVGDFRFIHPEALQHHPVGRFFHGFVIGPHGEGATGNPPHAGRFCCRGGNAGFGGGMGITAVDIRRFGRFIAARQSEDQQEGEVRFHEGGGGEKAAWIFHLHKKGRPGLPPEPPPYSRIRNQAFGMVKPSR